MITKEQIEEAAKNIAEKYSIVNHQEHNKNILECLFKEGANWAIDEFLAGLWHDAKEKPKGYNDQILLQYLGGGYYSVHRVVDIVSWKDFVKSCPIDKWLYIEDLLEGGSDD